MSSLNRVLAAVLIGRGWGRVRGVLAAGLLVMGASSLSACGVVEVDAVECSVSGDLPHESKGSPGYIVSKGRVRCVGQGRISSVTASIKIQRQVNGTWTDLSETINTRKVSPVVLGERYTIQNRALRCRNGSYRTGVKITSVVNGSTIKLSNGGWNYSKAVTNPCG